MEERSREARADLSLSQSRQDAEADIRLVTAGDRWYGTQSPQLCGMSHGFPLQEHLLAETVLSPTDNIGTQRVCNEMRLDFPALWAEVGGLHVDKDYERRLVCFP